MNKQYILKLLAGLIAVSVTQGAALSRADQQTPLDEVEVEVHNVDTKNER